jgi:MFS family permease
MSTTESESVALFAGRTAREEFKLIAASSVGSVFEWFDFFLYGSLAVIISRNFFSSVDETSAFILALLAFAAGFAVRPLGAVVFGFLGDTWGRKNTFIVTMAVMGSATFSVGLLPTYHQIGAAAPWILVLLRMLQGLSVGGVYGGAATYVAEHVMPSRRGFFTSWIQITPAGAMALSLVVIFTTRTLTGEAAFADWGWRIPFLLSSVLLGITIWIQLKLSESPVYLKMKAAGKSSSRPWADAFGNWRNLRLILIALFGAMIGQAVIWYTAQFYVLFFLERVLKLDGAITNLLVAAAIFISTPLYIFFGMLSDKIGRRPIILVACLLACLTYYPLFKALTYAVNPDLSRAVATSPVTVSADPKDCSFQFDPIGRARFSTSCDIVRTSLARAGVTYDTVEAPPGTIAAMHVGSRDLVSFRGEHLPAKEFSKRRADWDQQAKALVADAGYPPSADPKKTNIPLAILVLLAIMTSAAMVYGPMAALLTELFPAKVRYTSLSLPYHLGNGWFGGFLPTVAFAIVAATGNIYSGLWYPLCFAALTFVVGLVFLPETKNADLRN